MSDAGIRVVSAVGMKPPHDGRSRVRPPKVLHAVRIGHNEPTGMTPPASRQGHRGSTSEECTNTFSSLFQLWRDGTEYGIEWRASLPHRVKDHRHPASQRGSGAFQAKPRHHCNAELLHRRDEVTQIERDDSICPTIPSKRLHKLFKGRIGTTAYQSIISRDEWCGASLGERQIKTVIGGMPQRDGHCQGAVFQHARRH
jgi:hypothetical protein